MGGDFSPRFAFCSIGSLSALPLLFLGVVSPLPQTH